MGMPAIDARYTPIAERHQSAKNWIYAGLTVAAGSAIGACVARRDLQDLLIGCSGIGLITAFTGMLAKAMIPTREDMLAEFSRIEYTYGSIDPRTAVYVVPGLVTTEAIRAYDKELSTIAPLHAAVQTLQRDLNRLHTIVEFAYGEHLDGTFITKAGYLTQHVQTLIAVLTSSVEYQRETEYILQLRAQQQEAEMRLREIRAREERNRIERERIAREQQPQTQVNVHVHR